MDKKSIFATSNLTEMYVVMIDGYWGFCSEDDVKMMEIVIGEAHFDYSPFACWQCLPPHTRCSACERDVIDNNSIGIDIVNYFASRYFRERASDTRRGIWLDCR